MSDHQQRAADGESDALITPFAYAPPEPVPAARPRPSRRQLGLACAFAALLLFAWFLLTARAIEVVTTPANAVVEFDGGLRLGLGATVLVRPGEYTLTASAPGYLTRQQPLLVGSAAGQRVELQLDKLPGRLLITTSPLAARVFIDGVEAGSSNAGAIEASAGPHALRVELARFKPLEQAVEVTGMGAEQALSITLSPAWGNYRIASEPPGATILLDEENLGTTPAEVELLEGLQRLRITLAGYRDEAIAIEARAGETRALAPLTLVRADAQLAISSRPDGASITLDGVFQGRAPLQLALESGTTHELIAFKAGHERAVRSIRAASGMQTVVLELQPQTGEITLRVAPADAEIYSGARRLSQGSGMLRLPATPQTLSVRRAGFASTELKVTPRPGFPQELAVRLQTLEQQKQAAVKSRLTSAAGQELVLLRPGPFRMGSSRREAGRRANEALREVRLARPFYLGLNEITNAEYRQFRGAHSSGNFKGKSLNGDTQPAALVSWSDAALYCNWLSGREGLKPFYRSSGKTIVGADPTSTGYRMPTEAEWAWAATLRADGSTARFPWGDTLPPAPKAGNFADSSGSSILGAVLADYDDGFAVSAPVGRFTSNRHGLFDIGGNAAEWMHDLYEASPPAGAGAGSDPMGPDIGEFHVIRGASWRHGEQTELRLAFRDYGKDGRADVGIRIARYAE